MFKFNIKSSKADHTHRALLLDQQPLINAVRMKIVVARLDQLYQTLHRDRVVANDAQFFGLLGTLLRH